MVVLRNAEAVAEFSERFRKKVSVIPAGEQWTNDILRPAFEDLLVAGGIVAYLTGSLSPESKAVLSVYNNLKTDIWKRLKNAVRAKSLSNEN